MQRVAALARAVNALVVDWGGQRIPVTASFGDESYRSGGEADVLLFLADRALYRSKRPRLVTLEPRAGA